ncbi:MAG TPA: peptide chain release factor N(5)-glutamine methyltransferase [Rariglobus sp.]|jgi:release factor glutamine methyltransferase|nr:peptide chain release factor N(5)-glutamine methyltransferase [Rariglobus sp.]
MLTLLDVIQKTADFLAKKNVESARLNAELLIGHALGLKRMQLYLQFERALSEPELELIRPLVKRRGQREPLQYIMGETEWAGLRLKVDKRALIPRPETELLIELIGSLVTDASTRILDLGTGSGAIALALARQYAGAKVLAVDQSADALALAKENADALGLSDRVEFIQSNWFDAVSTRARYELIVANPPYLTQAETDASEPEVHAHEPLDALAAADEGMADLKTIIRGAPVLLADGGLLAMETGIDQHSKLRPVLEAAGFTRIESRQDLTGRDRFVFAWR